MKTVRRLGFTLTIFFLGILFGHLNFTLSLFVLTQLLISWLIFWDNKKFEKIRKEKTTHFQHQTNNE